MKWICVIIIGHLNTLLAGISHKPQTLERGPIATTLSEIGKFIVGEALLPAILGKALHGPCFTNQA